MTDGPNNTGDAANLGSAQAYLSFVYDRRPVQQFIADANTAVQAHTKVAQSARQVVSVNTTQVVRQTAGQVAAIQRSQITADARVQVARLAGTARITSAEQQRIARTQAAELAAVARVEAQRMRGVAQLEIAERRIAAQQARASSGGAPPRAFAGFTRGGITQTLGAVGLITSVDALAGKIADVTEQSIALANSAEGIGEAFQEETAKAGIGADELLEKLRQATRGTVSDLTLQRNAVRALMGGLTNNADELATIFEIARVRARKLGIDTAEAVSRITGGLQRRETELLDEIGLTLDARDAYDTYSASIGMSVDALTEQEKTQALVNNLIQNNKQLLNEAGDAALSNAEKQEAAQARIANAQARYGRVAAPVRAGVLENVAGFAELLTGTFTQNQERSHTQLVQAAEDYQAYIAAVQEANEALGLDNPISQYLFGIREMNAETFALAQTFIEMGLSAEEAFERAQRVGDLPEVLRNQIGPLGRLLTDMGPQLVELAGQSDAANQRIRALIDTFLAGGDEEAFRLAIALEEQAQQHNANAAAARANARAVNQLDQTQTKATTSSDDLKKKQEELADAVIRAGDEIADAQRRRTEALDDALDNYTDRVDELNDRSAEIAADTQDQINEAVADAIEERAELVSDGAERIADIEADLVERIIDINADVGERIADIQADLGERIADIQADLGERIADITRDYHDEVADEEARFQREQQQARERANTDALRGEANFIEQLFDLTRGRRGGRQNRAAAREQLEAAKREAAELAKIDPEAAARLLAARERQILEGLERRREEAQHRRDSARGQPGFSRADADEEAREESAAIATANQAEIDQIRREAEQRQQARDEETRSRAQDFDERIEQARDAAAEQLQEARDAAAEQTQEARDAAAEQLQEARAAAGQQIADIRAQTAERLAEFDEEHAQRLAQIREHGREQQAEIADQLADEEKQYRNSRAEIEAEYSASLTRIRDELNERSNEIFFPGGTEVKNLMEAYKRLGDAFGIAFSDAVSGAVANAGPIPVPQVQAPANSPIRGSGTSPTAGRTYGRGSRVEANSDAVLSDQAIDQIAVGGRQTGSFGGLRGDKLHQGVDIATPLNSPVSSPIDGTVTGIGSTREGGNYVIVTGSRGEQWYFGHLNAATVERGAKVRRGQVIARSGNTGTAITGPHVHVQLRQPTGGVVDPTASLEAITTSAAPAPRTQSAGVGARPVSQRSAVPGGAQIQPGEPLSSAYLASAQLATLPPPTTTTTSSTQLTVDMRGSSFGAGVDPRMIEEAARRGAQTVLSEYEQAERRQIEQVRTGGPRRAV